MAEIKNTFLGSKMNQDIDDRLIPSNEYRYALNLQINKSENSDVGTLQNILGNKVALQGDFRALTNNDDLECIGVLADDSTNSLYLFFTNHKFEAYYFGAKNYIYLYNTELKTSVQLVTGAFLNFSTKYPIYGINLIENLLFWTDNRNQPRKINVNKANPYPFLSQPTYYVTEEQISVAKLSPLKSPDLFINRPAFNININNPNSGSVSTTSYLFVSAVDRNKLSVGMAITGIGIPLGTFISEIPTGGPPTNSRKFFILPTLAVAPGDGVEISVTDFETSMYDVTSVNLPNTKPAQALPIANPYLNAFWPGDPDYLKERYVRFSYRYKFEDEEYSIMAPFTQIAYIPKQDGYFLGGLKNTGAGGSSFGSLTDENNTYRSTIIDFMQNKVNDIKLQITLPDTLSSGSTAPCPAKLLYSTYKIIEIEILYKEADGLAVYIVDTIPTMPALTGFFSTSGTVLNYNYQSKKPFKTLPNSDVTRVNDITPVKALSQEVVGNRVVYGNYQNKFSYPKFLDYRIGTGDKFKFCSTLQNGTGSSIKEYPNHSIKQNRNYHVGVVMGDRFGRESGVILSNNISNIVGGSIFGGSSIYVPYKGLGTTSPSAWPGNSLKISFNESFKPLLPVTDANGFTSNPGLYNGDPTSVNYNPLGWYSYKIVVKQTEQDYYNVYLPGILACSPLDPKLELEETSYTVLFNDNLNKIPQDMPSSFFANEKYKSSAILFPRVINIARDPASPLLPQNALSYKNAQFYSNNDNFIVTTIAPNGFLFFPEGSPPTSEIDPLTNQYWPGGIAPVGSNTYKPPSNFLQFYQINSSPFIARISTTKQLGEPAVPRQISGNVNTGPMIGYDNSIINLAVCETKPIESKLDIYWETSTSGTISEINTLINNNPATSIETLEGFNFYLTEADPPGTSVSRSSSGAHVESYLYFKDLGGNYVKLNDFTLTVTNGLGAPMQDAFLLTKVAQGLPNEIDFAYKIEVGAQMHLLAQDNPLESKFNFTIQASVTGATKQFLLPNNNLQNVPPIITVAPGGSLNSPPRENIFEFQGKNGSNVNGPYTQNGLVWSLVDNNPSRPAPPLSELLQIDTIGKLSVPSNSAIPVGTISDFNVRLQDREGEQGALFVDTNNITIVFPENSFLRLSESPTMSPYLGPTLDIRNISATINSSVPLPANYVSANASSFTTVAQTYGYAGEIYALVEGAVPFYLYLAAENGGNAPISVYVQVVSSAGVTQTISIFELQPTQTVYKAKSNNDLIQLAPTLVTSPYIIRYFVNRPTTVPVNSSTLIKLGWSNTNQLPNLP